VFQTQRQVLPAQDVQGVVVLVVEVLDVVVVVVQFSLHSSEVSYWP
jgi:hypothetical protein